MSSTATDMQSLVEGNYAYGFTTQIDSDVIPPGLDEDVIRQISARKN